MGEMADKLIKLVNGISISLEVLLFMAETREQEGEEWRQAFD